MRRFISSALATVLCMPSAMLACSAVTLVMDGKVILAHNNDNSYSREMLLRITPNRDGLLGRICISMETVPGWTPTGMKCINEEGFAITHANVPAGNMRHDPDKPQFRHNFLEKIAAECTTVKQAIAMVRAYTMPAVHGADVHLMVADATGDSAVIEWVDGEVRAIRRSGPAQIMTNFLLSKPETAGGPNSRFARGSRMLADVKEASAAPAVAMLKEMSIRGRYRGDEVGTLESAVFDVTGRKVYLYYKRDFDHPLVLNLDEELRKPARSVAFGTLFPNPVPFEPGSRYEDGPVAPKSER